MKTFAVFIALMNFPAYAHHLKREVFRRVVEIPVEVSPSTVRCSILGYSMRELKIDVPALDHEALFNHRSLGEGKPCMTAGLCSPFAIEPRDLLNRGEGTFVVPLTIVHTETGHINEDGSCRRTLHEFLSMDVNGVPFTHQRQGDLGRVDAKVCEELFAKSEQI